MVLWILRLSKCVCAVLQVAASAGPHLHHEQITWLFASAVAASGPGALAVTPAGFSTAVLDAGLVGSAAHLRRHPAIAQRPAFSDYRFVVLFVQALCRIQCSAKPSVLRLAD